jgi:hypothetical protein
MAGQLSKSVKRLLPEPLKPPLRAVRRISRTIVASLATPLRAHAYRSSDSWWLRSMPASLRRQWRFEPPPPGSRRIEVGSGWQPQPGYIHAEVDPDFPCVDLLVSGHSLPVRDDWADQVLNVHMIEHVPPPILRATVGEWFRVLRRGGELRLHTPNGEALGRALIDSAAGRPNPFWAVQSAIFGYYRGPTESTGPDSFTHRGDHRLLFTFPVLRSLLEEVGFREVENVSGTNECQHEGVWDSHIPGYCLEVRALKGEIASTGIA